MLCVCETLASWIARSSAQEGLGVCWWLQYFHVQNHVDAWAGEEGLLSLEPEKFLAADAHYPSALKKIVCL